MSNSNPIIEDCLICDNSDAYYGGGIYCYNSSPDISRCQINENSADHNGGGLYCYDGNPSLKNCTVANNISDHSGGGLYATECNIHLEKCSFSANSGINGGGIYCLGDSTVTLLNSIVEGSSGNGGIYFDRSPLVYIAYSDFWNNQNGPFTGNVPTGLGQLVTVNANGDSCDTYFNIFLDPCFVDTTWDDLRLHWGSPCIEAGDPDPTYNDPDGTVADMGAYYYDQSVPARVLLTPHNTPIQIPASGGSFNFTIWLTNIQPPSQLITVWSDVNLPDGSIVGPLLGPVTVALDSGSTISRDRSQTVPPGAPAGCYCYNAYVITENGDESTDSFSFLKSGSEGLDGLIGWFNSGQPFDEIGAHQKAAATAEGCILEQNYPNPFNPTTAISYQLSALSFVNLEVYDVSGRKVAELVNGWREAGHHDVIFDGSGLASGIYILRLSTGDFSASQKMMLLK